MVICLLLSEWPKVTSNRPLTPMKSTPAAPHWPPVVAVPAVVVRDTTTGGCPAESANDTVNVARVEPLLVSATVTSLITRLGGLWAGARDAQVVPSRASPMTADQRKMGGLMTTSCSLVCHGSADGRGARGIGDRRVDGAAE